MNKELIKKYKAEFDHWLNGGKLLANYNFTNISNYKREPWFEVSETFWDKEFSEYLYIVINDEYVKFRKALAEGKIIQVNDGGITGSVKWVDINSTFFNFEDLVKNKKPLNQFRIKPEEPQFKVGDFVRVIPKSKKALTNYGNQNSIGIVKYINDNLINIKVIETTDWFELQDCIKWEPKIGELCWFSEEKQESSAKLGYFTKINSVGKYVDSSNIAWKYCEPFLNSKPSWFKD